MARLFFFTGLIFWGPVYVFLKISEDNIKFKLNKNIFYLIYFSVFIWIIKRTILIVLKFLISNNEFKIILLYLLSDNKYAFSQRSDVGTCNLIKIKNHFS